MIWEDVSLKYAGLFFRVEGGSAGTFGQVQEQEAPRLTKVHMDQDSEHCDLYSTSVEVPKNGQSKWVRSEAKLYKGDHVCQLVQFESSGLEVRPRNMAMKVWKRTG